MSNPLTLESLEVLDAIASRGSFAAAAAALNKVPSAISYSVQKLEQDLGVTLFQRQGRKSILTTAGQHLMQQGRQLLLAADQLATETQQVATGWEPRLRIAIDHIIPNDYIHPLIYQLYHRQPSIDIELSREVLAGTWEALIENRVDLIVGSVELPPGHQGIRCTPWQTLDMIFVAAPDHPICQAPQPLSSETVAEHRLVVVRDSSKSLASINRGILNKKDYIYVPDMATKILAHKHGLGVGTVPKNRVKEELANGQLVKLILQIPTPPATIHIGWKTTNRGQALHWLVEQLQNQPPMA